MRIQLFIFVNLLKYIFLNLLIKTSVENVKCKLKFKKVNFILQKNLDTCMAKCKLKYGTIWPFYGP